MASVLADHVPIRAVKTVSGNTPQTRAIAEQLSQTFFAGVPVMLNAGVIKEWDAAVTQPATSTAGIAGVAAGFGSNLASSGLGAPGVFTGVGGAGASPTFGKVPFQPSAVMFTPGAPIVDGRTLFEEANEDTIFEAQFDDAGGSATNATTNANMVGKHFGLTKDATGHWYIDFAKSTQGTNTVVVITALDPNDGAVQNGRLLFQFEAGIQQLQT